MNYVIGISGASGSCYGKRTVEALLAASHSVQLIASAAGAAVMGHELEEDFRKWPGSMAGGERLTIWDDGDLFAPFCSGSSPPDGMAVVPCSMGTLARISAGTADTLLVRAADVCLKERVRLVLAVRETPLNLIHIENMKRVTLAGAVVLPASPGFYHRPTDMAGIIDHVAGKVLASLGIDQSLFPAWGEKGEKA